MGSSPKILVSFILLCLVLDRVNTECLNTGCRVSPGNGATLLCGGGQGCPTDHVYDCNNAGICCDFGHRKSCAECGKLKC